MSSTLIPSQDLVPSVSSRVVTIDATSMLEATPDGEHWVDFILPQDLHVAADDKIIMAGSERVTLDAGKGSIRLPTYDPDAKTVDGSTDWVILVKKSWVGKGCGHGRGCGCGGAYAIRVPVGTSSISLADLPAVRALTPREQIYAITGASVTVTEGGSWGASLDLSGGILNLGLTVPPGGTAWKRGRLADGTDANDLTGTAQSGIYALGSSGAYSNLPFTGAGQLEVVIESTGPAYQEATQYATGSTYKRPLTNPYSSPKQWGAWRRTDTDYQGTVPDGGDLNIYDSLNSSGRYALAAGRAYLNAPFDSAGQLRVDVASTGPGYQEAVEYATGVTFRRPLTNPYVTPREWGDWRRTDASVAPSLSAPPRLPDPGAPLESDLTTLTMWGDSLTHAGGIAQQLRTLLPAVTVVNRGMSGQNSAHIAGRQGGVPAVMTVIGGTIPASGGVEIDTRTTNILIESGYPARSLTGYLAGVHGTLSVPSGTITHTFTRTTDGVPVEIPEGAPFWTDDGIAARRGAQIIWMGRNNLGTELPTTYLPGMIEHLSTARKRVVVLSVTNSPDEGIGTERYELFQAVNEELRVMGGECFLDVRRWLIDEGLAAVGITPTAEDTAAVAVDAVPPSLTSDGIHFTTAAQTAIGTWLHTQLGALGWY